MRPAKARIIAIDTPASRGVPGPGEITRCECVPRERGLHRNGIVAVYVDLRAEDEKCLHQVVGEGVVVVDQQDAGPSAHMPSAAMSSARRSTALFARTSSYSARGELSATIPPPA